MTVYTVTMTTTQNRYRYVAQSYDKGLIGYAVEETQYYVTVDVDGGVRRQWARENIELIPDHTGMVETTDDDGHTYWH